MNDSRKKQRKEYKQLNDETEYEIRNGMRYVKPYISRPLRACSDPEGDGRPDRGQQTVSHSGAYMWRLSLQHVGDDSPRGASLVEFVSHPSS